jgi:hypothetical protein
LHANELELELHAGRRRERLRESQPELLEAIVDLAHGRTLVPGRFEFPPRADVALRR